MTYYVLGSACLDVGGESISYVAGWGEDGALEAIREYAATIDTIARRIEDALNPRPEPATDAIATDHRGTARRAGRVCTAPMIGQARPADPRRCAQTRSVPPTGLTRVGLMQPPTESARAAAAQRPLRGDEDDLYRRHHHDLRRAVAHAVNAPPELIEDACQNAWTIMLRAQPDRVSIFGWLYVVATREAFRLCERERRHIHLETMLPDGSWDAVIAGAVSIDDIVEAREALKILARLPDRQRVDLTLLVAGFSHVEIAAMTGGRTYTNVNKHIAKARARVRLTRLADAADARPNPTLRDVL